MQTRNTPEACAMFQCLKSSVGLKIRSFVKLNSPFSGIVTYLSKMHSSSRSRFFKFTLTLVSQAQIFQILIEEIKQSSGNFLSSSENYSGRSTNHILNLLPPFPEPRLNLSGSLLRTHL